VTATGHYVPPTHWGMSKAQIREFHARCKRVNGFTNMSARDMVKQIIEPEYQQKGRSVALDFNSSDPLSILYLVSHSWDENADEFFEDLLSIQCPDSIAFFVCFLCVYQGTEEEINLQVNQGNPEIEKGCFAKILAHVAFHREQKGFGAMFVIPNDALQKNGQGLYSRLWCSWEIFNCLLRHIPVEFHPKSKITTEHLFGSVSMRTFTCAKGHCGPPDKWGGKDEIHIKRAVEQGCTWEAMDRMLKEGCIWGRAHFCDAQHDCNDTEEEEWRR
jgi:hypothetical protein